MEAAASTLFRAMDGLGTDEDAIHAALRGRSPAEVAEIRRIYADHYPGRTLDADLSDELSGDELSAAQAALSGDPVAAAAAALQNAASGLGTDEEAIHRTLEGISDPTQRAAVAAEFERRTGQTLDEMLEDEMGGSDLAISRHLATGDVAGARAARMDEAMNGGFLGLGLGTDEESVYSAIESCRTAEERRQMLAAYRTQTGRDLSTDLASEMEGADLDVATSLVSGDRAGAAAARMAVAADGMGTDEDAIFRQLEGKSFEERAAIISAYNNRYGEAAGGDNFQQMLDAELGEMDGERARQLALNGRLDPVFAMRYAMDGIGTDEEMIRDTLRGRSAEDIARIREQYNASYDGADLDAELADENSGRDGFEISQMMLGEPRTPEEVLARANAAYDFERGSGAGLFGAAVTDMFSDSGEMLDLQHQRLQELGERLQSGEATDEDMARLQTVARYQTQDVANYQASRDAITNSAAIAATAVVGTAATIASGGVAGPAVAAAIGALAGGAAGMGMKYGMQGASYSEEDMAVDGAMAVVSAASAGALQGSTVTAGLRGVMGLAGNATASVGQTVAMEAMRGGAMGLVNGVAAGALDERTWRGPGNGLENFLGTVGTSTLGGAASGAGSAAMGGLMGRAPDGMDPRAWGAVTGGLGGVAGGVAQTAVDPAVWEGRWEDVASRFGQNAVVGAFQGAVMGASEAHRQMLREQAAMSAGPPRNIDDPAMQLVDNAPPEVARQAVDQSPDLAPDVAATHPEAAAAAVAEALPDTVPDAARAAIADSPDVVQMAAGPDARGNTPRTMEEFIARVRELQAQGAFANSGFHGTSSEILPGLAATDGSLVSAQELHNRGITQVSGEGDAFSGASGLKRDIFIGTGEAGLGTGLAYANASETLPQYNPSVLTAEQLNAQIAQLGEITTRYPEVAALAQQGGIMSPDGSPQGPIGSMVHQSPEQLQNTLARLQQEAAVRAQLAGDNPNHPRIAGGPGHGDNYPVMFEFGMQGVDATPVFRQGDALAGEATVPNEISLRDKMQRAFAPMANLPEAQAQLMASLGHGNFEMIPLEALQAGLQPGSQAARSQAATLQALQQNQARVNAIQQMYMNALMSGQPIDFMAACQALQGL